MGNICSISQINKDASSIMKQIYDLDTHGINKLYDTINVKSNFENTTELDVFHNPPLSEYMIIKLNEIQQTYNHSEQKQLVSTFINKLQLLYNTRIKQPKNKLNEKIARKIFNFQDNIKINETDLKIEYKKLALKYHPDRSTGNEHKFSVLTNAYNLLLNICRNSEEDKDYSTLKSGFNDFKQTQKEQNIKNKKMDKGKFSLNKFNKLFKEYRTEKPEDNGYDDWIKNSKKEYDEEKVAMEIRSGSGASQFNKVFDKHVKPQDNTDIIEYGEPMHLYDGGENAYKLGEENIKNFGGKGYTDLKEAHSGKRIIDINDTHLYNHKNVDTLKNKRKKITNYTDTEWSVYQQALKNREKKEDVRIQSVEKQDNFAEKHYNSIHSRMLENVWK
jgi:curved DNA-binding protein CbpA